MTRLLVSVRNHIEAREAMAGGADIIDVKEPDNGALGRAEDQMIGQVVQEVAGRAPVSAAMGELVDLEVVPSAVLWVKTGLARAPLNWRDQLGELCHAVGPQRLIAVAYADAHRAQAPPAEQIMAWALEHKVAGVLIDTAIKDGTDLFDWCADDLSEWIDQLHRAGMIIALAGRLSGLSFRRAIVLNPDIVAVRGAACAGDDRRGSIDSKNVRLLKQMIEQHTASAALHVN